MKHDVIMYSRVSSMVNLVFNNKRHEVEDWKLISPEQLGKDVVRIYHNSTYCSLDFRSQVNWEELK